jgi:hypothetical protein
VDPTGFRLAGLYDIDNPDGPDRDYFRKVADRASVPGDVQGGGASERDVREVRLALIFHQP